MDGHALAVRYSIITYAVDGIKIDSVKREAVIEYSTISNCSYAGIYIFTGGHPAVAANTRIANNSILFNGGTFPPHPVPILGCGVFIKAGNVTVQDNLIMHNSGVGIWVAESNEITIVGNVVSWTRKFVPDNGSGLPMLCGNGVLLIGWGLMKGTYNVTILRNRVILNEGSGIHVVALWEQDVHGVLVKENVVGSNKQNGIWLESERPLLLLLNATVVENSIFNNDCGVLIERSQEPSNIVQYNDIYNNVYGMNATYVEINAEHNYWGDENGPYHETLNPTGKGNSVNQDINANLDFIPFLASPVGTINQRPAAMLLADKPNLWTNEIVTFDASASTDDGQIDYYFFDFGDGSNSSWTPSSVVTHKYAEEGVYNATLIVMDDFGVTSLDGNLVYATITVVPEFPLILVLPLFIVTTLLIAYKRKRNI
jgi:parallel beta-helix repeat protein